MTLPAEKKNKAFALYCQGLNSQDIADYLGIKNRATVYNWIQKKGWKQNKQELLKFSEGKTVSTTRAEFDFFFNGVMELIKKKMTLKKDLMIIELKAKDAIELFKLKRLYDGESTENVSVQGKGVVSLEDFEKAVKVLQEKDKNE